MLVASVITAPFNFFLVSKAITFDGATSRPCCGAR